MEVSWPLTDSEQSRRPAMLFTTVYACFASMRLQLICSCKMREKSFDVAKHLQGLPVHCALQYPVSRQVCASSLWLQSQS